MANRWLAYGVLRHFQQNVSYIVVVRKPEKTTDLPQVTMVGNQTRNLVLIRINYMSRYEEEVLRVIANKTGSKRGNRSTLRVMANKTGSKRGNRSTQSNGQQKRFKDKH
jgi:hypothetical protein